MIKKSLMAIFRINGIGSSEKFAVTLYNWLLYNFFYSLNVSMKKNSPRSGKVYRIAIAEIWEDKKNSNS